MSIDIAITPRTIIEAFLPNEGAASLDLVYDTANAAGISDQPLRLGLRRMVTAGEIVQTGRGRQGAISLTDAGRERLHKDRLALRLAFAQDQGLAPWDGRWRLLAVSAPESQRSARDLLRRRLVEAGAAAVSTGLYLTPHDLIEMLDTAQHTRLVQATATEVNIRGVTDPLEVTELIWPGEQTVAGYAYPDRVISAPALLSAETTEAILVEQLRLAEALERALRSDPLIPPELRHGIWSPTRTRHRWYETWHNLATRLPEEVLYRGWLPTRVAAEDEGSPT